MQIDCPICKKNFEVDASLIPDQGRLLQCGYCNYKWFFKKNEKTIESLSTQPDQSIENLSNFDLPRETENIIKQAEEYIDFKIDKPINQTTQPIKEVAISDKNQNVIEKILSITIVGIISFIAMILLVDTFKTPLSQIFPRLEFVLFSLYETLIDVKLFIIDLI
ncbi:zinc-ribbon domain-containing protein [Candidatus Pelagibacter sp.]|nr:zinc-ribbon domain-containing protein [Candidatus Pelagibacter sp.]